MTVGAMAELAVAVVLLAAAVVLYRRRAPNDGGYGSQGAVIVLVVGVIMAIHALGLLEYRPSQSEIDAFRERAR
jgi:hypothetical protein